MTYHKYGAKRVSNDGYSFASKFEAALYQMLKLEMKAGLWTSIKTQVQVRLTAASVIYKPDFMMTSPDGEEVYAEAKGYETDVWRIKRRLWMAYGPGTLLVYKGSASRIYLFETITPKGAA